MIIVLTLSGLALVKHEQQADATYQAARQKYEQSKQIVPEDVTAHRPYTADKPYREEWRAEQDLEAQRIMAWWSKIASIATCVGVMLLAATLYETTRTTRAASAALEHAKEATQRELRAYVALIGGAIVLDGVTVRPMANFRNSGQTPAFAVRNWGRIEVGDFSGTEHLLTAPPDQSVYTARSITAPGGEFHFNATERAIISEADDIETGRKAIFFLGSSNMMTPLECRDTSSSIVASRERRSPSELELADGL